MFETPIVPCSIVISVLADAIDIPKVLAAYWEKGYNATPIIQSDEGKVMLDISKSDALWLSVEEVVADASWGDEVQGTAEFYGGTSFGVLNPTAYTLFQQQLRNRIAFTFTGKQLADLLG